MQDAPEEYNACLDAHVASDLQTQTLHSGHDHLTIMHARHVASGSSLIECPGMMMLPHLHVLHKLPPFQHSITADMAYHLHDAPGILYHASVWC